jgi:hypothetical protein
LKSKITLSRLFFFITCFLFSTALLAQYPPAAGKPGTTAIYKDSSAFIGWASTCTIERGFINISDTTELYNGVNKTTYGSYLYASGPADELVVSLGDHGSALLSFDIPIVNKPGPDFAVFENSFGDAFLELGFVEVSSDGERFVRFPAVSLTPETLQIRTFDTIDATKIHNFAGKYRHGYGTPFDLDDIKDSSGIDLNNIFRIRIIDAIGCITSPFTTFDSQGHKVNDPWPTPFDTGGFDLDAVGVIHNQTSGFGEISGLLQICIYPNPVISSVTFDAPLLSGLNVKVTDLTGKVLSECDFSGKKFFDMASYPAGIYFASFSAKDGNTVTKKIVKY